MDEKLAIQLKNIIGEANQILITSHIRPDGDAVGSLLGLGLTLEAAGKDVQMVLADGVPATFNHLGGCEKVTKHPKGEVDISIVLDCSDIQRVGNIFQEDYVPTINIDHHVTNLNFAQFNLVDPGTPSTAEMLANLIPKLGFSLGKGIAEALLTGMITDTLGFRTSNMQAETLRTAADLMEFGCDLPYLYNKALHIRSFEAVRYWGAGLSTLEKEDRLLWACLTQKDRQAIGYPGRDDADLINILSSIDAIDIAIIFVEQANGSVKVSWRARKGFDVSQIARSFGGGGHKPAAGAEIEGDLDLVKMEVLEATRNYLKSIQ
jgi:phosphoesterase RecJ-like protein